MSDDCYEDKSHCYEVKSLLTSASTSMLGLSISDVNMDRFKSLPRELIPEILSTLPIKSLVRFTAVSKSWDSTIKKPDFIHTHLTHPLKSDTHLFLVHNVHSDIVREVEEVENPCSLYHDNTAAVTEYCKLEFPIEFICRPFRVVGTCNGLVLLADDYHDSENFRCLFGLWNPAVRMYLTLPDPFSESSYYSYGLVGLGYGREDYKVVRITTRFCPVLPGPDDRPITCEVFSLAKGVWSTVSPPDLQCVFVQDHSPVQILVHGALHWWVYSQNLIDGIVWSDYFILTFDVATESFGQIMLPKGLKLEETLDCRLSVSGDRSIALFVTNEVSSKSVLEYWVLEDYSEKQRWTQLMVFGLHDLITNVARELCFRKSSEVILLLKDGQIVSLDMVSKEVKHLGMSGGDLSSVHSYEESLVLLGCEYADSC